MIDTRGLSCPMPVIMVQKEIQKDAPASLEVLAVVAYCANTIIGPGANYLFMAKPEDTPSILDILPPNFALRVTVMAAVITLMFFLSYLPWLLKDRKAAKNPQMSA